MKPEHWATSQSIFRYVYCWLLGFLLFPRVSTLEAVGNALGDSHLHFTNSVLLLELKLYFMWNKIFLASSQKEIKEIKTKNSIRSSENMFSVVCSPPPLTSPFLPLTPPLNFAMYPCAVFCLSVLETPCSQILSGSKTKLEGNCKVPAVHLDICRY